MVKPVNLRVRNSFLSPALADQPKVQLSRKVMDEMGLAEGDIVELRGEKTCGGIVCHSYMVDPDSVRLPSFLQRNAGTVEGGFVSIKRINPPEARLTVIGSQVIRGDTVTRYLREKLIGLPVCEGDIVPVRSVFGPLLFLRVVSVDPPKMVKVGLRTIVTVAPASRQFAFPAGEKTWASDRRSPFLDELVSLGIRVPRSPVTAGGEGGPLRIDLRETTPQVRFEDIGGLLDQVGQVREMVELPLRHPEVFKHFGIKPPKGVLFIGSPGTGKTLLARAVASSVNANVFTVRGPEFVSKWYGASEEKLREIFSNAKSSAPSIIIFDEIDSVARRRSQEEGRDVERRIVATLLTLMDGMGSRGDVVIIGTTNDPDAIDPALRRPGRFDREILFPVPDASGRHEIFKIHTCDMPLARDVDLVNLSGKTHGMSGADIEAICREAALNSIRRHLPELEKKPDAVARITVEKSDFEFVLDKVGPSSLRGWLTYTPKTGIEDIGGLHEVKRRLLETIILPAREPERYKQMGVEPIKGVILHGPPGTGKTMLCRWIASETESNTMLVNSTETISKFIGESEKNIRTAFDMARSSSPCILIFDEIDAICPARGGGLETGVTNRVVSTFLMEMDGLKPLSEVLVIGTTNRIDLLDSALLRPGRFDLKVEVAYPSEEDRLEIFKITTRKIPLSDDVDLSTLSRATTGFSGADISGFCREAALNALRNGQAKVSQKDFENALKLKGMRANDAGPAYLK